MKKLKIKFGFFSLLGILAVSVFFTSCEQQLEIEQTPDISLASPTEAQKFIIPQPEGLSDTETVEWLNSLSIEELIPLDVSDQVDEADTETTESRACTSWTTSCRFDSGCYCPGNSPYSHGTIEFCKQYRHCEQWYYNYVTRQWHRYWAYQATSEWQNTSWCSPEKGCCIC